MIVFQYINPTYRQFKYGFEINENGKLRFENRFGLFIKSEEK